MITKYNNASELPKEWDDKAEDNCYLKREFLTFLENTENCNQLYYIFKDADNKIDSILMTLERSDYNLLMFTKHSINIKITMIYVPISISRAGMVCGKKTQSEVEAFIKSIKGYKIILNTPEELNFKNFAKGLTCPRCVLTLKWHSFDEYINDLRSNYRYRFNKALKKSAELNMRFLEDNSLFDENMYELYLQVYSRSRIKVEKLPIEFFRGDFFKIFVLESNEKVLGFTQLLHNESELIFEFVGFDHDLNSQYDIYLKMLLEIIRYGINNNFTTIDFGQTADDAKLKLGCNYTMLYALLHSSNPIINSVCKCVAKKIQYKPLDENSFHVMKGENLSELNKNKEK